MDADSDRAVTAGVILDDLDTMGVMRMIPHRFPMLMLDRLTEVEAYRRAVGVKLATINEPFFAGHFPNDPIMPGVLIIEAMAQAAATLIMYSLGEGHAGRRVYFMGVEDARFRRPVRPGDELRLEVVVQASKLSVWKFTGRATVGGELCTQAHFAAKMMGH